MKTELLQDGDLNSGEFRRLCKVFKVERGDLREHNEDIKLDAVQTAEIRGRIGMINKILKLNAVKPTGRPNSAEEILLEAQRKNQQSEEDED